MAELPRDIIYHYESKDGLSVTITMTELVRCSKCKYWNGETHGCTRNPSVKPWFESDYCNYGARMVDNNE